MGYKLAGFDVIGGVEIDQEMMNIYRANHVPKHSFCMSIVDFNKIPNSKLPPELFELDILDGSPPCSVFSMAGARERKWGKKHAFREGQTEQVLDELFSHFLDTVEKLSPKIVIAENVTGMLKGNAKGFVKMILDRFNMLGYNTQLFRLNAAKMGVPQRRERIFFIANRIGKTVTIETKEKHIAVKDVISDYDCDMKEMATHNVVLWKKTKPGGDFGDVTQNGLRFNYAKFDGDNVSPTICAAARYSHWNQTKEIEGRQFLRLQTFPDDFNCEKKMMKYICGMSVPPFMMQRIAKNVYEQMLLGEK